MTVHSFVQTVFPRIDPQDCVNILWGRTCYPMGSLKMVHKQLRHYVRIVKYGVPICMWCNGFTREDVCSSCAKGLGLAGDADEEKER